MLEEFEFLCEEVWFERIEQVLNEAEEHLWQMRCPLEKGE